MTQRAEETIMNAIAKVAVLLAGVAAVLVIGAAPARADCHTYCTSDSSGDESCQTLCD
jgi:hypothetical protein